MDTLATVVTRRLRCRIAFVPSIVALTYVALSSFGTAKTARALCPCDCNGDCRVTVDELVTATNVALGAEAIDHCVVGDISGDLAVTIPELVSCVGAELRGCTCASAPGCGNGLVEPADEQCDDGGVCLGGANAGRRCTAEQDCQGNGVCVGGPKNGTACAAPSDCPFAACRRCVPVGGDGCAANCTVERAVAFELVPGVGNFDGLQPGTSGLVFHNEYGAIVAAVQGSRTFVLGMPSADGALPVVIQPSTFATPVSEHISACLRDVPIKTCGGTLFESDGNRSASCTEDYAGGVRCPAEKPCAFAFGPGNAGAGVIACGDTGLPAVDVLAMQNAGGCGNPPTCNERGAEDAVVSRVGQGPRGSVVLVTARSTAAAWCDFGCCTDADPPAARGSPMLLYLTTGSASVILRNAEFENGFDLGPYEVQGMPVDCQQLTTDPPKLTGFALVGGFPLLAPGFAGLDSAATAAFVAQ